MNGAGVTSIAGYVSIYHGVILAVGKHIVTKDALTGGGKCVRIEESAEFGVIITGLEVIQSCFGVALLAVEEKASHIAVFVDESNWLDFLLDYILLPSIVQQKSADEIANRLNTTHSDKD